MNDLLNDPKIHTTAVMILMALAGWFGRREIKRIDTALADSVRRQELEQLREDMDARHVENRERLERIEDAATGTHRRIDEFLLKLPDMMKK